VTGKIPQAEDQAIKRWAPGQRGLTRGGKSDGYVKDNAQFYDTVRTRRCRATTLWSMSWVGTTPGYVRERQELLGTYLPEI